MAAVKEVTNPENSPKTGAQRPRSGVTAPYYDLNESVAVAKAIQDNGGIATREQLAAYLNYKSVDNGAFLTRVSAARMFGLIELTEDRKFRPTARAQAIFAPILPEHADKARVDAFLAIEVFKRVFENFKSGHMPPEQGLRNLLENEYRIVKDRVPATVRILLDSAEQAGFFKITGNRSRMILPPEPGGASGSPPPAAKVETPDRRPSFYGGDEPDIPPAIRGLVNALPPSGAVLSRVKREALINAFTAMVDLYYADGESVG